MDEENYELFRNMSQRPYWQNIEPFGTVNIMREKTAMEITMMVSSVVGINGWAALIIRVYHRINR